MVDVEIINIFPRYDIYFFIPFLIQGTEPGELRLLKIRQIGKIREYYLGVLQDAGYLDVIAFIFNHFEHQLACPVKLRFHSSKRCIEVSSDFFV